MILKLMDSKEFYLTDKQADQVSDMLLRGAEWIKMPNGNIIKSSVIASITDGADPKRVIESQRLFADVRTATDEGIRKAREHLTARLEARRK